MTLFVLHYIGVYYVYYTDVIIKYLGINRWTRVYRWTTNIARIATTLLSPTIIFKGKERRLDRDMGLQEEEDCNNTNRGNGGRRLQQPTNCPTIHSQNPSLHLFIFNYYTVQYT